jgi:hypothetical protein
MAGFVKEVGGTFADEAAADDKDLHGRRFW